MSRSLGLGVSPGYQVGRAADGGLTDNKAFPSLALSFELGLGMAKKLQRVVLHLKFSLVFKFW